MVAYTADREQGGRLWWDGVSEQMLTTLHLASRVALCRRLIRKVQPHAASTINACCRSHSRPCYDISAVDYTEGRPSLMSMTPPEAERLATWTVLHDSNQ
jgi:hypothetical protein